MGKDDYKAVDGEALEEPDLLSRQQINQCIMDIQDMHPIAGLAKYYHIMPCLKIMLWCKCKKKSPNFSHALRASILDDMAMKMPENDADVAEDPFILLGYGINSFFDLMQQLFWFAIFVTIFLTPLMIEFSNNNGLQKEQRYMFNQFSLGNMGGTTVACNQHSISDKEATMTCYDGVMSTDKAKFGILSTQLDKQTYCREQAIWDVKANDNKVHCSKFMQPASASNSIQNQIAGCNGKAECKVNLENIWNPAITRTTEEQKECNSETSQFFFQVPCEIDAALVESRDRVQILGLTLVLFVFFFSVLYIDYIDNCQKLSFIDWDVKTITAGDYSIEFDIENETYDAWLNSYYDKTNPMSENAQFKLFVQNYLEDVINNRIPDQDCDDGDEETKAKKCISQITCAYENKDLIDLMVKRGKLIGAEKWVELKALNKEISDKLHVEKFMNDMQTPVSLFVTFETEEGHARACAYDDFPQSKFLGQELDLQEASEPTDIIWENRQLTQWQRNVRKIIVLIFIGILLSGSGTAIYFMRVRSDQLKGKYPPTDCKQAMNNYIGSGKELKTGAALQTSLGIWETQAVNEYTANMILQSKGKPTDYGTTMQCFCNYYQKNKLPYEGDFTGSDDSAGKPVKAKICSYYFSDKDISKAMGLSIAIFIVVINLVLQMIIIKCVDWIGEDTHSQQLETITNLVFIAQFFNTGLLLLLINANVTEHQPKFLTGMLAQSYYDYVPMWYSDVGYQILQTMIINAIKPPIMVAIGWAIPALKRWLDRHRTGDIYLTKKTSMAAYKALYCGADYKVQVQYSQILNVAFITMFYGAQMPLLFPIAACTFIVNFVCQRFTVAYQVKLPAALDDRLTKLCVTILQCSCYAFAINGFWAYFNLQIFQKGAYHFIDTNDAFMKSGHLVHFNILWVIFGIISLIVVQIFKNMMSAKSFEVDEDLPKFFQTISLGQADMMVFEEKHCQDNFGVLVNDPDTIRTLDDTEVPEKAIQGTPWYTVLSNQYYMEAFGYVGAYVEEREKLIEDGYADVVDSEGKMTPENIERRCEQSDMVFLLLNLAVVPDDVIKECDFSVHGWASKFKDSMNDFKAKWEHGEWKYQDADLEEKYAAFVKEREQDDTRFQDDKRDYLERKNQFNEDRKEEGLEPLEMTNIN